MKNILSQMLTGKDNVTVDIGRVLWGLFGLSLLVFEGYSLGYNHAAFDPVQFCTGAAAILAGGGAALGMKVKAEPEGDH